MIRQSQGTRGPSASLAAPVALPVWLLLLAGLMLLSGCVNQTVKRANPVALETAERELPPEQVLNVNVSVFDPNVPEDVAQRERQLIFPAVRRAEARYLAYELRRTLEETGQWGAVRVVPQEIDNSELQVQGEIVLSNGEFLELKVKAVDATGRRWLDKTYTHQAASLNYTTSASDTDPFQSLYNQVANDLLEVRRQLDNRELVEVRRVAEMRFAADIAPEVFGRYVEESDGRFRLAGLPAQEDPMVARIERIRARDELLIDSLDQHYRLFHDGMDGAYSDWRAASYQENVNLREMKKESFSRKLLGATAVLAGIVGLATSDNAAESVGSQVAIFGGGYLFASGVEKGREAEMHSQALKELGGSLGGDLEPRVIELEGETVTLHGSAEAQYREWRELLREIHAAETGLPVAAREDRAAGGGSKDE